jgi:hypothetical protein
MRHLQFDSVLLTNDICLIKLAGTVPAPIFINPDDAMHQFIILNSDPANEQPGKIEAISGWGITAGTSRPFLWRAVLKCQSQACCRL